MTTKNLGGANLKDKDINQLLKLEELFHSHYLTEELINGMVNLYVKFTQNIAQNQQFIRHYFMEKIKFVLSRSEVIRILEKKSNQGNKNIRQGTRLGGQVTQEEMEIKRIAEETKDEIRRNHNLNGKKQRVYVNTAKGEQLREKERNMQIEMQIQIMEQVEQNMKQMKKQNDQESWKNKEKEINKIVEGQDKALQQRLAKRKRKLMKKSVELKQKEVVEIEAPPPIAKKQLLEMKKQLHQTYERFTRLTMNKTKRVTQLGRENEGRVKAKVQQAPIYQQDIFDQLEKEKSHKQQEAASFSKKKKESPQNNTSNKPTQTPNTSDRKIEQKQQNNIQKVKQQIVAREADSSIEYKAFDQNKGRVTVRQKNYEQIEDEQLF